MIIGPEVNPSQVTGWWLRLRRRELGMERTRLARRAAQRGDARVTRTLLVDLELGRRQPNLRTLAPVAACLEVPAEFLAGLVLAADTLAARLSPSDLSPGVYVEGAHLLRAARGALVADHPARALVLAEEACVELAGRPEQALAQLVSASAAIEIGAPAVAAWRAAAAYERGRRASVSRRAALVFARVAWASEQGRLARFWLERSRPLEDPLDRARREILEGRVALDESCCARAQAVLLDAHESALLAGCDGAAAEAGALLADVFERLDRPDLAKRWRRRRASSGLDSSPRRPSQGRKSFG